MSDLSHPFFRPLWRRLLVTALVICWGLFEAANSNAFWAVVFLGFAAWMIRALFLSFEPQQDPNDRKDDR